VIAAFDFLTLGRQRSHQIHGTLDDHLVQLYARGCPVAGVHSITVQVRVDTGGAGM